MDKITEIALGLLVLAKQEHTEAGCFSKSEMSECVVCAKLSEHEEEIKQHLTTASTGQPDKPAAS
jgi:hypothetical protein